jgi:hypothetical protein
MTYTRKRMAKLSAHGQLGKLLNERDALVAESRAITYALGTEYESTAYAVGCAKLFGLRVAIGQIDADIDAIQREIADTRAGSSDPI